jgi:fumarate reductase flavoprotein subunit
VIGTVAEKEGEDFEIKAGSVVVATGGFPGNIDLLKQYCPDYNSSMHVGKWPYHTGDGLLMASEVGAAIAKNIPIFHLGPTPESGPRGSLASIAKNPFTIWVNKKGRRFIDEAGYMNWESGNAILMQPDKVMYTLFDEGIRSYMEEQNTNPINSEPEEMLTTGISHLEAKLMREAREGGVKISSSWEEIAKWIGAHPEVLKAEIREYNSFCDNGCDDIFAKNREYLRPLCEAPFYAIKCVTHCGETMGGIKVNEHMEVLDSDGNRIPGLYAAGVIADGWASQTYCCDEMSGSAAGFAINSGRIAGENAAEYTSVHYSRFPRT